MLEHAEAMLNHDAGVAHLVVSSRSWWSRILPTPAFHAGQAGSELRQWTKGRKARVTCHHPLAVLRRLNLLEGVPWFAKVLRVDKNQEAGRGFPGRRFLRMRFLPFFVAATSGISGERPAASSAWQTRRADIDCLHRRTLTDP